MAITVDELKYILTLDAKRMRAELERIDKEVGELRKEAETPMRAKFDVSGFAQTAAQLGLAINGVRSVYQLLQQPVAAANAAFLEQDKSVRKLEAAAKLTGTSLEFLRNISVTIKEQFQLTTQQANEFVVSANKLTKAAGDISQTEAVLKNLFDIAAAQGLTASEALLRFEQAIKGVDEGTEALFSGLNPSDLYAEYAEQLGKSVAKMNDMEKKQAIINRIFADGAKVSGEYSKFLESAAGQQEQLRSSATALQAAFGQILNDFLLPILNVVTPVARGFANMDEGLRNTAIATTAFLAIAVRVPAVLGAIRVGILGLTASTGIGALIALLGATASAYALFADNTDDATAEMIKNKGEFEKLTRALIGYNAKAKLTNDEQARRRDIIKELNEKYPDYLKNINLETATNNELYAAINDVNRELERRVRQLALQDKLTEQTEKAVAAQQRYNAELEKLEQLQSELAEVQDDVKATEKFGRTIRDQFGIVYKELDENGRRVRAATQQALQEDLAAQQQRLNEAKKALESQFELLQKLQSQIDGVKTKAENVQRTTTGGTTSTTTSTTTTQENTEKNVTESRKIETLDLSVRDTTESAVQRKVEELEAIREVELEFSELGFADLETQFEFRRQLLDEQLQYAEKTFGKESEAYKTAAEKKLILEKNFQEQRTELMKAGAEASINLLAQFFTAFQGQSRALFEIGKAASIAQAIVNTYEGATKALAAYPPPFGGFAAAATIALGFAQIENIRRQSYQIPGKAKGGYLTEREIYRDRYLTPPGESGIVAVQIGEYIVDRQATKEFLPLLQAISQRRLTKTQIPKFASGGLVTNVANSSTATTVINDNFGIDSQVLAAAVEDAIIAGIEKSQLRITGQLTGEGSDLKAAIDRLVSLQTGIQ
jgi:ribosome-associated translation inhibitor RaiA